MGVKTVRCEACRRDIPRGLSQTVVVEAYELIVCLNPVDCRMHQPKDEVNGKAQQAPQTPETTGR